MYYPENHLKYFQSESSLLFHREISRPHCSIGYSVSSIKSISRVNTLISHTGCINTVKYAKDGMSIISGKRVRVDLIWKFTFYLI